LNSVRRVAKNTIFLTLSNLVQKALTFVLIIFIARQLGVEDFGLYSFALSFVVMFTMAADIGLNSWVGREIARERERASELLAKSIPLKLASSLFSVLAVWLVISLLGYPSFEIVLVLLAAASMALDSIASLFRALFTSFERMELEFLVNTAYKLAILLLSLAVLFAGYGVFELLSMLVLASLLNIVFSIVLVYWKKVASPALSIDFAFMRKALIASLPFCFMGIFSTIYSNVDIAMLHYFQGNQPVGIYSAAFRLVTTVGFLYVAYIYSIYPMAARFFAK